MRPIRTDGPVRAIINNIWMTDKFNSKMKYKKMGKLKEEKRREKS